VFLAVFDAFVPSCFADFVVNGPFAAENRDAFARGLLWAVKAV